MDSSMAMEKDARTPDITVIVTVYNQPLESLLFTIRSILLQKESSFEIIIADDCSDRLYEPDLKKFFSEQNYSSYYYSRCTKNQQTVVNIKEAISHASGEFVKCIGTGDALYDQYTLRDIISFSKRNNLSIGFGRIATFHLSSAQDGLFIASEFNAPRNPESYNPEADNQELLSHQLLTADWVPAPTQFFRTTYFKDKLLVLLERVGIRYCEDFALTLALMDEEIIVFFFDRPLEWYEMGVGISTSGNKDSVKRMYLDHSKLYKRLEEFSFDIDSYSRARLFFSIRHFIATTPFYRAFQKYAARRYMESRNGDANNKPNQFFYLCR